MTILVVALESNIAGYRRRIKLIDLNKQWDVRATQQSSTYTHTHTHTLYITHFGTLQQQQQDEVVVVQCTETHTPSNGRCLVAMANGADNDSISNGDEWAQFSVQCSAVLASKGSMTIASACSLCIICIIYRTRPI